MLQARNTYLPNQTKPNQINKNKTTTTTTTTYLSTYTYLYLPSTFFKSSTHRILAFFYSYNPNRLDVAITSGQGVFKHDHEPIGQVEMPPFIIKGGAITDVLVTLVFTPSVWKGLQLDLAFQTGEEHKKEKERERERERKREKEREKNRFIGTHYLIQAPLPVK